MSHQNTLAKSHSPNPSALSNNDAISNGNNTAISMADGQKVNLTSNDTKTEGHAVTHVMTKLQQDKLTPDQVLEDFIVGNKHFQTGKVTLRDFSAQARQLVVGQYPKAVVLSCLDSRVPVEDVFDQGLGDVFVIRVAGNLINEDILGSMELACKIAGAKLVLVMGHQHCSAIQATIEDVQLGNLTALLAKIRPAVHISEDYTGVKDIKNDGYVRHVCENNVRLALDNIRQQSPVLKAMEDNGQIKIVGAFYTLTDGTIKILE